MVSAREFKSADGRTVSGELVGFTGDQIYLQVGAKEFVVDITGFSEEDQDNIRFFFFFDLEKLREDTTQGKAPGYMTDDKLKVIPYEYEFIVFNRAAADVTDLEIRYEIYIDDYVNVSDNSYTLMATCSTPYATLETVAGTF